MLLVIVASACFGTLGTFSKLFYDEGGDAYTLMFLRFAITGPVLGLVGVFQFGVAYALFEGYARAPVALVTLLFFAYPLLTVVGAAVLFRERIGARKAAVLAVALAGVVMLVGVPDSATWVGVVLGLVAAVCVASLILSSRYLLAHRELAPLALSGLMFTSPAIGLALVWPGRAPDLTLDGAAWGWALCAVLVAATFPIGLYYTGVSRTEAGVVGLLSSVEPLVSVLLAFLVLDESLGAVQAVGGVLVLGAVVALSLPGRRAGVEDAGRP
jgi:drug/metabolite transporter (DMT)-like permease